MSIYGNMLQESYNEYKESEYLSEGFKQFFDNVKGKIKKIFKGKSKEEKEQEAEIKANFDLKKFNFVKKDGQMSIPRFESTDIVNELFGLGKNKPKEGETRVGSYNIKILGTYGNGDLVATCDKIMIANKPTYLYGNRDFSLLNPNLLDAYSFIANYYDNQVNSILGQAANILNGNYPDANIRVTASDIKCSNVWAYNATELNSIILNAEAYIEGNNMTKRKEGDCGIAVAIYYIFKTEKMYLNVRALDKKK